MKALILNSGAGRRMGVLTQGKPKGLTEIGGGYTILSHQLTQLRNLGIDDIIITTGPFPELLQRHVEGLSLGLDIRYVHSTDYVTTNYITSIHLAAPLLAGEDVLLLHGDLVMEDSVLGALLQSSQSVMAVDSGLPLPEKDFKARLRKDSIVAVGVEFFGPDCVACQPAYKWLASGFAQWLASIAAFVKRGDTGVYAEAALNALDGAVPLAPLELNGRLCHEIDNPEDLALISRRFLDMLASPNPQRKGGIQ